MNDFYYTPNSRGKREITLTVFLAMLAVFFLVLAMTGAFSRSVLQFLFVLFVAIDIFFCIRYFLSFYRYTVTYEYGEAMLIVTQTQGKRITTLANFKLCDVTGVEIADTKEKIFELKRKFKDAPQRFSYTVSISPVHLTCLTVRSDYTVYKVLLETDSVFSSYLISSVNSCTPQGE